MRHYKLLQTWLRLILVQSEQRVLWAATVSCWGELGLPEARHAACWRALCSGAGVQQPAHLHDQPPLRFQFSPNGLALNILFIKAVVLTEVWFK